MPCPAKVSKELHLDPDRTTLACLNWQGQRPSTSGPRHSSGASPWPTSPTFSGQLIRRAMETLVCLMLPFEAGLLYPGMLATLVPSRTACAHCSWCRASPTSRITSRTENHHVRFLLRTGVVSSAVCRHRDGHHLVTVRDTDYPGGLPCHMI